MAASGTYVYCLVAASRRPELRPPSRRLPGVGPLRLLEVDRRLWMAVADAPLNRYGERAINEKLSDLDWVSRAAVAHEAMVESFIDQRALLPMKLFTIFSSDNRALEQILANKPHVDAVVKRVANHLEWGVRITHLPGHGRRAGAPRTRVPAAAALSGASYLLQKKTRRDAAAELAGRAQDLVNDLYDRLAARASLARRRTASDLPIPGGLLLLDAAFLVSRSRAVQFRGLVTREADRLGRLGYQVALSGPWPPHSFVKE